MPQCDLKTSFKVGDWKANRSLNLLEHDGRSIRIEPRSMDVLVYLATRPGEVISINELIEVVWRNNVTDGSVYRVMNQLRRILKNGGGESQYIQTVPKRGYRLIAEVSGEPVRSEKTQGATGDVVRTLPSFKTSDGNLLGQLHKRQLSHALGVFIVVVFALTMFYRADLDEVEVLFGQEGAPQSEAAEGPSIAVLRFKNLSTDPEDAFFADGLKSELLTQLAKVASLKVISSNSVRQYEVRPQDLSQIAGELGVTSVLEGSIQKVGDSLRVDAQLIDAETAKHIWAENFSRELTASAFFAIQREIVIAMASALQAQILPEEHARLNEVPTENLQALKFYLKGKEYMNVGHHFKDAPLAEGMYTRAVQEDPEFALAWTALSRVHFWRYFGGRGDRMEVHRAAALKAVEQALELDPHLPEAHLAIGEYYYKGERDYARALIEYELAEEGMPGAAELLRERALIHSRLSQWDLALEKFSKAYDRDPRNLQVLRNLAEIYLFLREYSKSREYFGRMLKIDPDNRVANSRGAMLIHWRVDETDALMEKLKDDVAFMPAE